MKKPWVIAHRGASGLAEENTIQAFEKAIELKCNMTEFDIRRTVDGVLIVFHDRNAPGNPRRKVNELTYEEFYKRSQSQEVQVPTLEQLLRVCSGKIGVMAEIKEEGYEEDIITLLHKHLDTQDFMVASFNERSLVRVKSIQPDVKVGLILGPKKLSIRKTAADFFLLHWTLLGLGFLTVAKRAQWKTFVWTVDDKDMIHKLIRMNVDGIITNRPDIALSIREGCQAQWYHPSDRSR